MVIPVLDEVNHLPLLLADLEAQDLPASEFDVLVLDGGSSDGTRDLLDQHVPRTAHGFAVLENPGKTVPHARNIAMAHLSDDVGVVVELIGHVRISPDHLSNRRRAWEAGFARHGDRFGALGVRVLGPDRPSTVVEGWVDGALRSSLGRGGGQFAHFTEVGPTKVPAFASHSREAVEAVGGWDVALPPVRTVSWPCASEPRLRHGAGPFGRGTYEPANKPPEPLAHGRQVRLLAWTFVAVVSRQA